MTMIRCLIEGCLEIFTTAEPVSPSARFTCRYHARRIQVEASGRIYDLIKDNTDAAQHFDLWQGWTRYDSFRKLPEKFDGNESFVNKGYQTPKARNPEHKIPTPSWMFNDAAVEQFIQRLFPRANRNLDHRMRAIVYRGVIYSYFRAGQPDAQVV